MTHSLMTVARATIVPIPLYFAIARTRSKKWGAGSKLVSAGHAAGQQQLLYLSTVLKHGRMDALSNTTYRCRRVAPSMI